LTGSFSFITVLIASIIELSFSLLSSNLLTKFFLRPFFFADLISFIFSSRILFLFLKINFDEVRVKKAFIY